MLPKFIPLLVAAGLSCKQKNLSDIIKKENISRTVVQKIHIKRLKTLPFPRDMISSDEYRIKTPGYTFRSMK